MSSPTLRIGIMPYLLGRPLLRGLIADGPPDVEVVQAVPSSIGQSLIEGKLDAALGPIAMTLAHPELRVIPGLGVACDGPVASIKLFHRVPLADLRRVALDTSSRSSALLAKIILQRFEGASPEFVTAPPDLEAMLAVADGALLIGDNALVAELRPPEGGLPPWQDLGERWKRETGLGFVFAMWAYRSDLDRGRARRLAEVLYASLARGEADMERVADEDGRVRGIPREMAYRYLTENIRYRLQEVNLAGLARYVELAVELGLLPEGTVVPEGARMA